MKRHSHTEPASRMVFVAGFVVVLVFGMLLYKAFYMKKAVLAENTSSSVPLAQARSQTVQKDTDNDGLLDWQETLWGTDPTKPDTDNDGVSDSEEVKQGRDPLVAGVGAGEASTTLARNATSSAPLTATEAVARELFGVYVSEFQQDQNITPERQQEIVERAIAKMQGKIAMPTYSGEGLLRVASTTESHTAYKNVFKRTLLAVDTNTTQENNALTLLAQKNTGTDNGVQAQKELTKASATYRAYANTLKTMTVPEDIAPLHIALIEHLLQYAYVLDNIGNVEDDPVQTLALIGMFSQIRNGLSDIFQKFAPYVGEGA